MAYCEGRMEGIVVSSLIKKVVGVAWSSKA
jgi:hypothetical protein